jgi:signal transduction histidine kinase
MDLEARTRLHEELKRADRRSMFRAAASEIAHELLTPLNVVQARAQLLSLRESDDEIDSNVQVILDQVQRVAVCLRQMVDAASGEGPRMDQVSLPEICDEACQLVRPLAQMRRVTLDVRSDIPAGEAQVDRMKTLQLLTNVMANSVDAMPDGGTIEITADPLKIEKTGDPHAAPGSYVRFTVQDRGRGFDVSGLSTRLSNTPVGTAPKLGFFVCRNVLKELGGWMTVESEPGKGATIVLYIPDGVHS